MSFSHATYGKKSEKFNPGHPDDIYDDALAQFTTYNKTDQLITINQKKYQLIRDGIQGKPYQTPDGETIYPLLKVIKFNQPEENHFLVVRELSIQGSLYSRRPDIIGFVNGKHLLFIELKATHRNVRVAYEDNYTDYKDTISKLFHYNISNIDFELLKAEFSNSQTKNTERPNSEISRRTSTSADGTSESILHRLLHTLPANYSRLQPRSLSRSHRTNV